MGTELVLGQVGSVAGTPRQQSLDCVPLAGLHMQVLQLCSS